MTIRNVLLDRKVLFGAIFITALVGGVVFLLPQTRAQYDSSTDNGLVNQGSSSILDSSGSLPAQSDISATLVSSSISATDNSSTYYSDPTPTSSVAAPIIANSTSEPNSSNPGGASSLLLYSSGDENGAAVKSLALSAAASQTTSDFGNGIFQNDHKELYLSPDRQLVAVTITPPGDDVWPSTYITKIDGTKLTSEHSGAFISWAPDSSKVLLYYSPTDGPWIRKIYALDTQDKYYDTGLPDGTINADISPVDGSILYSFTSGGTDNSTLYLRDPQGKDKLLLQGESNIFAWARWSPKGDKIVFLKSDLLVNHGEVWIANPDGAGAERVSDVEWGYPPVWSSDGTKMAFSNAGDIWEYDVAGKSLRNATNFSLSQGGAEHPSYSADGNMIVFSSNGQVWKAEGGSLTELTNDNQLKDYPILP